MYSKMTRRGPGLGNGISPATRASFRGFVAFLQLEGYAYYFESPIQEQSGHDA
jgi:hypothetical protein